MADPRDARPPINAIRAIVRIQTPPEYDPRIGQVRPGELIGFDTGDEHDGIGRDLLSVLTTKRLQDPCGRFTLTLSPREVLRGSTWADLIPPYSLVEIYLQSYPRDPQPVLVMLGLTDTNQVSEDFSQAEPVRTVQIAGRELSCIFVDQQTLYLPVPPDQLTPQLAPALFGQPDDRRDTPDAERALPPTSSRAYALFGLLAIDPELAAVGASPVDVIDRFVRMCTVGLPTAYNPSARPLLNFQFPDAQLRDLLFFDRAKAAAALFDPAASLPAAAQLSPGRQALWNLMTTFSDPAYMELFAIPRDVTELRGGTSLLPAMEVVFRKPPFGGRISANGELVDVPPPTGSQFDQEFVEAETVSVGDQDVLSTSVMRTAKGVRNVYLSYPQVPGFSDPVDYLAIHAPLIDADRHAPASALRFGPRLMSVADYYMHLPDGVSSSQRPFTLSQVGQVREQLLWAWHRFEPLFWRGTQQIRGTPRVQVGKRIVDRGRHGTREFYCTGVTHSMTLGSQAPRFVTQVSVERGWPVPE